MERCLWLISVASKRQWSVEHRDALSVLHSDLVLGPVDTTAVFTQATYMRYASAPPRLDAAPARLPRNVSILQNPASIPRPDPAAPVSGPGPIRPPPVHGVSAAKKPRKARFVQEMEGDEMFIPTDDASVDSKPMERRDFTKMSLLQTSIPMPSFVHTCAVYAISSVTRPRLLAHRLSC